MQPKLFILLGTLMVSLISPMPLAEEAMNGTTGELEDRAIEARAWNSPNEFMFYVMRYSFMQCSPGIPCVPISSNSLIRRDSCTEDACSDAVQMKGVLGTAQSLCDRTFTACRVPGARWKLIVRKTGDFGSCENPSSVWIRGKEGRTYATLHDDQKGGRRVGRCWVSKAHKYVAYCGGQPFNIDSVVRCSITPP